MGENFYNNSDEKYNDVIGLLKQLPKVNAPENFEYNLMTKIQNKNFELNTKEEKKHIKFISWTVGPTIALGFSVFILFFLVTSEPDREENPLMALPEIRTESIASNVEMEKKSEESFSAKEKVMAAEPSISTMSLALEGVQENNYRTVVKPNDVVIKERIPYPFNEANDVNVDNFIGDSRRSTANPGPIMSVEAGRHRVFNFNGFYLPLRQMDQEFEVMKNRIDSLKTNTRQNELGD